MLKTITLRSSLFTLLLIALFSPQINANPEGSSKYCSIDDISIYEGPYCDYGGTHYVFFEVTGENFPYNLSKGKVRVWIQGKKHGIYEFHDYGRSRFVIKVAHIKGCCESKMDVKVQLPGGCYLEKEDVYEAPDCGHSDDEAPELSVASDTTIYLDSLIPEPSYSVSDNCDDVEVSISSEIEYADEGCEYTMIRTYVAEDPCGNTTTATQTIYVKDVYAPVIVVQHPMLDTVPNGGYLRMYDCGNPQVDGRDIYYYDDCPYDLSLETYDRLVGSDLCDAFGYYRKWRCGYIVTDAAGNETEHYFYVLQYDTVAPELHGVPEDITLGCDDTIPAAPVVYATDNCRQTRYIAPTETTTVDTLDPETMIVTRTWYANDGCGNSTEASQVITICAAADTTSNDSTSSASLGFVNNETTTGSRGIAIFPNPTVQDAQISFEVKIESLISLRIYDRLGRLVSSQEKIAGKGQHLMDVNLNDQPTGVYFVSLAVAGEKTTKTIIKSE